jgi:CII-binding regulator of phage lambda lysogenization HflD
MLNHNSFMIATKSVTEIATQSTLVVFDDRVQDLEVLYHSMFKFLKTA